MDHIKDILSNVINAIEKHKTHDSSIFLVAWRKIVGVDINNHTKPIRVKNRQLYVVVDSSTWVYELNQRYKQILIDKINDELKDDKINDIYFRVGDIG